ncbi:MAG TPA: DsbA family oxidoreductase [Ilumatobacteraceae bacterium]|nr:DsbA family oxidoreductase [Ilumatobacteraceae bacterium]
MTDQVVRVEIWSDIVCPWCYIGKRRFEKALADLDGELDVDVVYRPFQLDPTAAPGSSMPVAEAYARKFGGPEQAKAVIDRVTAMAHEAGIEFRMDRALRANTLLAHRLLWLAEPPNAISQTTLKERLLQAYFIDGLDIGDPDVLADCAADVGFGRDEVVEFLAGDGGMAEVTAMLREAHDAGITAVPTYVIDRQWAIPGAQDPEVFVQVLRRFAAKARQERQEREEHREHREHEANLSSDAVCIDDTCER